MIKGNTFDDDNKKKRDKGQGSVSFEELCGCCQYVRLIKTLDPKVLSISTLKKMRKKTTSSALEKCEESYCAPTVCSGGLDHKFRRNKPTKNDQTTKRQKKNPKTETKAIKFPPHLTLNCQHGVSCRVCLVFSNLTPDPLERPCRHQPTERGVGSTKPREHHHRALPICEEPQQQQKKRRPYQTTVGEMLF